MIDRLIDQETPVAYSKNSDQSGGKNRERNVFSPFEGFENLIGPEPFE